MHSQSTKRPSRYGQQARYDALDEKWNWELSVEEKAKKAPLQDILDGDYSDAQRALSGAVIYVNRSGDVAAYLGIVKGDDVEQAIEAGFATPNQHEDTASATTAKEVEKPTYSQKFMDDLKAIRLAAVQTALLQKPELVLDLLAYGLAHSGQSIYSSNDVMAVGFSNHRNKPENPDEGFQLAGVRLALGLYRASLSQANHATPAVEQGRWASNGKTLKATTGKRSSIIEQILGLVVVAIVVSLGVQTTRPHKLKNG